MFDADIDALFDVPIPNSFVDYDSDSRFCNVVDDTGFAVIDFVGHAEDTLDISHGRAIESMYEPLLNSSIGFDVDYVTNSDKISVGPPVCRLGRDLLVLPQIRRELDVAFFLEVA